MYFLVNASSELLDVAYVTSNSARAQVIMMWRVLQGNILCDLHQGQGHIMYFLVNESLINPMKVYTTSNLNFQVGEKS